MKKAKETHNRPMDRYTRVSAELPMYRCPDCWFEATSGIDNGFRDSRKPYPHTLWCQNEAGRE